MSEPREILMRFEGGLADGWQLAHPEPAPESFSWNTVDGELLAGLPFPRTPGYLDEGERGYVIYDRTEGGPDAFRYVPRDSDARGS